MALHRFPFEISLGLRLGYLRTYASPRVAGLMAHTGHAAHAPLKRATDTALFMYELIHHGLDSPVGHHVVEHLNQMHSRWAIRDEDYLWILGTFVVLPIQAVDRYGWRKLLGEERQALVDWYRELGTRMGILDIPSDYNTFEQVFRDYEVATLRRTEAGQRLLAASWHVALDTLPAPARPLALRAVAVLTDEPARSALGLRKPDPVTTTAIKAALLARGIASRWRTNTSQFTPGGKYEAYPNGYTIDDLGVGDQHRHPDVDPLV